MKGRYCKTQEENPLANVSGSCCQLQPKGRKVPTLTIHHKPLASQHIQSPSFLSSLMITCLGSSLSCLHETETLQTIGCSSAVGETLNCWPSSRSQDQLFLLCITTMEETEFFKNQSFLKFFETRLSHSKTQQTRLFYYFIPSAIHPAFLVSPSKVFNFYSITMDQGQCSHHFKCLLSQNSCPNEIRRQQIL